MGYNKSERVAEFIERLRRAPRAANEDEAYRILCDTLNALEDELTSIPHNPDAWRYDGRLYPPQYDSVRTVGPSGTVKRFRSRRHFTYIATNGAIEIHDIKRKYRLLAKPGADGAGIGLDLPTKDDY